MGKIIQLSKNVINQIAAGEVIERPYSVVKELAENSVDAGATKISIEISNECRNIRLADNGCGISPDDIILAFSKHATSKISNGDDLYNITTMGFRGEALASIISVSKLTCITRTKENDAGIKVECENSEVKQSKTGCAIGTIMEIRDLFYNIPARLKFLKSSKTEFAYISELIQSLALAYPNVSFELKNNGKTTLKTTGQNNIVTAISEIFNNEIIKNLKHVHNTDKISELSIDGYVSLPDYTRSSKKDYYMFINNRTVKCPVFQKSVDMVYKHLTANSRYPFIVLNLKMPPADVDVNVHPSKREVRYKNPNQIFNFIYSAVDAALTKDSSVKPEPPAQISVDKNIEIPKNNFENQQKSYFEQTDLYVEKNENIAAIFNTNNVTKSEPLKNEPKYLNTQNFAVKNSQEKFISQPVLENSDNIIGQYKKTYILIERDDGLEIVDQHIAEERYIYEQLKKSKNVDCQLLFISDIIPISPSEKDLLETNLDKLLKYGYEIDFTSDNEVIFRKIPQILSKVSPKEILADILEHISGSIDNIEEQILITTSCKAAVKANTYLNQFQMQEIIRNWRKCEKPYTCPHGRPISKILKHNEIAAFFRRNK